MSLVVLAQLRFLRQSWLAVISALLGMTLGVASVVGVHLLSERVEQEVTANSQPLGGADLYLQRTSLRETDYFELANAGEQERYQGLGVWSRLLRVQCALAIEAIN